MKNEELIHTWNNYLKARGHYFGERQHFVGELLQRSVPDIITFFKQALLKVKERRPALELLLNLEEIYRRDTIQELVKLASVAYSDIDLVRQVILSIDKEWLSAALPLEIQRVIKENAETKNIDAWQNYSTCCSLLI
jgi:hypothetical protein